MQALYNYHIKVKDKMDEDAFNLSSPLQISVLQVDSTATLFSICTDQSGLIGLIRHLHNQGYILLKISRDC